MSPRWATTLQARVLRQLAKTGFKRHHTSPPSSPNPSKVISIPSRAKGFSIKLYFYFPTSYSAQESGSSPRIYPVVINFHGGAFTFGSATDDARWCKAVTEHADAVAVSVEYRLAPEYPFPAAIEDGVDATLYIMSHAEELRLDPHRVALSGFSAGGNMAFAVPMLLYHEIKTSAATTNTSSSGSILPGTIVSIASWYPTLDYSRTRAQRRASNPRPDQNLPPFLTSICDASYMYSPSKSKPVDLASPWLSPGIAPDDIIRQSLPNHIIMYTCEYDMLCAESKDFKERLAKDFGEKKVVYHVVNGVRHAWDKAPVWDPKNGELYKDVCLELKEVFLAAPAQSNNTLEALVEEPSERKEEVTGTA